MSKGGRSKIPLFAYSTGIPLLFIIRIPEADEGAGGEVEALPGPKNRPFLIAHQQQVIVIDIAFHLLPECRGLGRIVGVQGLLVELIKGRVVQDGLIRFPGVEQRHGHIPGVSDRPRDAKQQDVKRGRRAPAKLGQIVFLEKLRFPSPLEVSF